MHKTLEKISEVFALVVLVLVFAVIGTGSYFLLSYLIKGSVGIIIGIITGAEIIVLGIYRAVKAYKKEGTMYLLTRNAASPEIDKEDGKPE